MQVERGQHTIDVTERHFLKLEFVKLSFTIFCFLVFRSISRSAMSIHDRESKPGVRGAMIWDAG
jgi:hypothetical protein